MRAPEASARTHAARNPSWINIAAIRCDDQHYKRSQSSATAIVVAGAAKAAKDHGPASHGGNHGDRAGERGGNRGDQDIVIADVRKLVRDDAFELVIVINSIRPR